MKKILYFAILVAIVSSYTVSIGSCIKYSFNGRDCQKCTESFHLFNGSCFEDIPNCVDYQQGKNCQKCSNDTILVSNSCVDSQTLQKMLKSNNGGFQEFTVKNLNTIQKVVDFVERGIMRVNGGKLISFDVKEYKLVWRWFLLYQFDGQFLSHQRIIVDMDLKSQTFSLVDFSPLKNPEDFSTMLWRDVEDNTNVLRSFSDLYSSTENYLKISVRKAILSQVTQFQILTISNEKVEVREICSSKNGRFILEEYVQSLTSNSVVSSSGVFHPYELSFQGSQIDAELDANEGLFAVVNLIKGNPLWNHTLTQVVESAKASNWTEYTIVGRNDVNTFKAVVNYNPSNRSTSIAKLSIEAVDQSAPSTKDNEISNPIQQSLNQETNKKHVEQDGCVTHTSYSAPFEGDLKQMAEKLSAIKREATLSNLNQNSSTPFIQGPGLNLRRIVVSSFCQGYNYREVAYVQGNNVSTTEYFTYYLEQEIDSVKTWYFLGNKNKTQTTAVYSNPTIYPINFVDPSFVTYPTANLYTQSGVASTYLNNLSDDDRLTFIGLTKNLTTEKDRKLGKMQRFSFDASDDFDERWRATGWRVISMPDGFIGFDPYMSLLCPEILITETLVIGSNGPKSKEQKLQNRARNLMQNRA